MMGDQGEQWTAQELRHQHKRGWKVVNDVALKRWNTDHVIVGGRCECPHDDPVAQATDRGTVHPVLMLWGGNAADLAAVQRLVAGERSVTVVSGPKAKEWLRSLPSGRLTEQEISKTWSVIDDHCTKRDAHDADDVAVPLSFSELGTRAVLAVLGASASFLAAATWLGSRPSAWLWVPALAVLTLPALVLQHLDKRSRYLTWGWLAGVATVDT